VGRPIAKATATRIGSKLSSPARPDRSAWSPSNEFLDELDTVARQCGESVSCLIAVYARARSLVLVFDDDACGGGVRDSLIEIRTQGWDPLFKVLRAAGHSSPRRRLELRPRRHQAYDCAECELIWDNDSA
jgi:hypothetical protein